MKPVCVTQGPVQWGTGGPRHLLSLFRQTLRTQSGRQRFAHWTCPSPLEIMTSFSQAALVGFNSAPYRDDVLLAGWAACFFFFYIYERSLSSFSSLNIDQEEVTAGRKSFLHCVNLFTLDNLYLTQMMLLDLCCNPGSNSPFTLGKGIPLCPGNRHPF